jgi:hypothetical protein
VEDLNNRYEIVWEGVMTFEMGITQKRIEFIQSIAESHSMLHVMQTEEDYQLLINEPVITRPCVNKTMC